MTEHRRRLTPGRRVPSDPGRPRLSDEAEAELADLHQRSAELLDGLEDVQRKADELAADLEDGIVSLPLDESDTALHHLTGAVLGTKDPGEEGGG